MNTAITERMLIEGCKARNHVALAELIHQNSPTVRRIIRAITRGPADVDAVIQDTFVNVLQRIADPQSAIQIVYLERIAIANNGAR